MACPGESGAVYWQASGIPPPCPNPLIFTTPVNLSRVTSILYPGQMRGNAYKPHGGFRFDAPGETGDITVVAPMASTVYRAARSLDNGEIQYMFDFINACGILYRLGHLRDLSAALSTDRGVIAAGGRRRFPNLTRRGWAERGRWRNDRDGCRLPVGQLWT